MRRGALLLTALGLAVATAWAGAAEESQERSAAPQHHPGIHLHARPPEARAAAPGYSPLEFAAPAPGTYELPALGRAGDGRVLDDSGRALRLSELYGDKAVVLSLIYTSCADRDGCPLASFVLSLVQREAAADPLLRESLRLVSLSFDPVRDDPARMRGYASTLRRDGFDWRFLTCASEQELAPILESFGQGVHPELGHDAGAPEVLAHLLRVYLIDRQGRVRNVYTPSFLHSDLLLADIRTILAQHDP